MVAGSLLLSAVFVALTLRRVELRALGPHLVRVSVVWLGGSVALRGVALLFMTARSQILFSPLHRFGAWRQMRGILLALLGNNVLPFRAGELLRVGYLSRHGRLAPEAVLATVALEKLLDLVFLLLLFLSVLPMVVTELDPGLTVYLMAAGLAAALGLFISVGTRPQLFLTLVAAVVRPLGARVSGFVLRRAERFAGGLSALRSPWRIGGAVATSAAYWTFGLFSVQGWLWAFGLELPWYAPLLVMTLLAFGTMLPAAPSFVGTFHYFASWALVLLGVEKSIAVSFGIVGHAMTFLPWTLLAIPFVSGDLVRGFKDPAG